MSARSKTQGRATSWLVVPLGMLLVGLGILLGRFIERPAPAGTAPKVVRKQSSTSEQRLAALEREVQSLRVANALRPSQPGETNSGDDDVDIEAVAETEAHPPESIDLEEADRLAARARRGFLEQLSDKLDTEPFDQAWRQETERLISQLLPERFGPDIAVNNVSCASSLCRARVSHPGSTRLPEDKLMELLSGRKSLGNMEIQFDTRDDGVTTLYFLRPQEP